MTLLAGKLAIVTGGTSGIGKRIVEIFVEQGAKVVAAARREAEGRALEQALGDNVRFIRTDIADEKQVQAMIDFALAEFGRIDCLVNNAAVSLPMTKLVDVDLAQFDQMIATNYRGVLLGMKIVAPHLIAQRSGSIINISSVANIRTGFSSHGYTSAKAAVTHLTRSVASDLGPMNIRVNSISPGAIATGIFGKNAGVEGAKADRLLDSVKDMFANMQPIPRSGVTDDIAHAAVFLASDWSSFITGHDLVVDGGVSLGGLYYQQGMDLRGELYKGIMQAAERLNS